MKRAVTRPAAVVTSPGPSFQDAVLLADPRPRRLGRGGETEHEIEGMQMGGTAVGDAAEITPAPQALLDLGLAQQLRRLVTEDLAQELDLRRHPGGIALLVSDIEGARLQIAGDGVTGDEPAHQRLGLFCHGEECLCLVASEERDELGRTLAQTRVELAAVAPRGAPAHLLRLEQQGLVAALGKMQGGGKTRQPAADHAGIDARLAGKRRTGGRRIGGGGIIGGNEARHRRQASVRMSAMPQSELVPC